MTNVSRHARARRVEISVQRSRGVSTDEIAFRMADDGRGADLRGKTTGLGLIGMRERVEMLGGRLDISTAPGHGFHIEAAVPAAPVP